MAQTVIIPRLRRVLRERHMDLAELHRRLLARGHAPSRATLARLAQERPIATIRTESIIPVLEELELPLGALFETVPLAEWEHQHRANGQARATARALSEQRAGRRGTRREDAAAETDAVITRLERELRTSDPELFDARGRLRKRALVRRLAERFGGMTIEGDEVVRLVNAARAAKHATQALR